MNKLLTSLLALAAFAGVSAPVIAQPAPKIVIVDMAKILTDHYETVEQEAKLKADEGRANDEIEKIKKEGQELANALKEMDEKGKNPALTTEAKEKLQNEFRAKYEDMQRKQQELQSFASNTQRSFQQRIQSFRKVMFDKISATVSEVAKKKSANLVLDKSGFTSNGWSPVIYSDTSFDITEEVQKEINKGRPAGSLAAPATTTAPKPAAKEDGAKVTFPGAK